MTRAFPRDDANVDSAQRWQCCLAACPAGAAEEGATGHRPQLAAACRRQWHWPVPYSCTAVLANTLPDDLSSLNFFLTIWANLQNT
eukprot:COSAG01_NODE_5811_length_4018_cov_10.544271_4_plen_86_part_00